MLRAPDASEIGTAPTISRLHELRRSGAARCALFLLLLRHPQLSCTQLFFWCFHIATRCQSVLVHYHQLLLLSVRDVLNILTFCGCVLDD